jgi:subtilisin family serine protease
MKHKNFFLSLSLALMVFVSCTSKEELENVPANSPDLQTAPSEMSSLAINNIDISDQYIVVLKKDDGISGLDVKGKKDHINTKAKGLLKKYEVTGDVKEVYETALEGFVAKIAPGQLAKMAKDPQVDYIEADQEASILARRTKVPTTTTPTTSTSQSIPWGITRVGGGATYTGTNSAWVIDSGILLSHPDLNVDLVRGISFVTGVTSPNDDNGHGTHVAGTIAAINNSFGVVGVAAGAKVVPVKVMDSSGSGTTSSVLAGINYVMSNGKAGDVVNMSIGAGISPTIDDAVLKASAVLKFAIAAGNESDYAYNYSPGRVNGPNVYTVSAMDSNSSWAYFSNFGNTTVDYCAPGMTILSTYKNGSYIAISGTSMAAPHVAGLLLLGSIATSGYVTNDPDGTPDRIAHR